MNDNWKTFGGKNFFNNFTSLNADTITANSFSLRDNYYGLFAISGELIVYDDAFFDKEIEVLGNIYGQSNIFLQDSLLVGLNVDISNDLNIFGNSFSYQNTYLVGPDGSANMYFVGGTNGIGLNKPNPTSTLDINGTTIDTLNVYSSQSANRNILARNNNNYGITLSTDNSAAYIDFFHANDSITSNNTMERGEGTIMYEPTGTMTIDVSKNIALLSQVSISNRPDYVNNHISNEALIIYDYCYNIYLSHAYNTPVNSSINTSLISNDNSSNTFLRIENLSNKGWQWGAGSFPNDLNRNMATMGWTNTNNEYIPTETIVSSTGLDKIRSTIGVNTYSPEMEKYIMDINGPIHLRHNEIHWTQLVHFEISAMSFSRTNPYNGIAVGTSLTVKPNYEYQVLYTTNGGNTWNISKIDSNNLASASITFSIYYLNDSNIIISGNSRFTFFSNNNGQNWTQQLLTVNNTNQPGIYISPTPNPNPNPNPNSNPRLFLSYAYDSTKSGGLSGIYYFDNYSNTENNFIPTGNFNIYCSHGYNNILYVAGNGIQTYKTDTTPKPTIITYTEIKDNVKYNSIYTLDGSYAIAVGNNIISYTKNGGTQWIDISWNNIIWRDVFIWDTSNAIAVGNAGNIVYTRDGATTWNQLTIAEINAMGNADKILNTSVNISSVKMTSINHFIFSVVQETYSPYIQNQQEGNIGITNLYQCYLPDIFNHVNSTSILDICGNMTITGDININDAGKLSTNNDQFYLLNKTASTIYFAGDASSIFIGKSGSKNTTFVRHQLDVSENTYLHNNVSIDGIAKINNTTNTTDLTSGALQIVGGASIQKDFFIGGNTVIYQDISLNRNQVVGNNLTVKNNTILGSNNSQNYLIVNGISILNNDVSMNRNLYVLQDVSINSNLFVKNNTFLNTLVVAGDVSMNRTLVVSGDVSLNSKLAVVGDVSLNSKLAVSGDVSLNSKLFVVGDVSLNNKLIVGGDVSFNKKLVVYGDVSLNSNVFINKNQTVYGTVNAMSNVIVNGETSLNGDVVLGSTNTNTITMNGKTELNGNLNLLNNASLITAAGGNVQFGGNLSVNGSNITLGEIPPQNIGIVSNKFLNIYSKTLLNNTLSVLSDISSSANIYSNNTIYSNRIESIPSSNDTVINIATNTYQTSIANNSIIINFGNGTNRNSINIGNSSSTITLQGDVVIPKTLTTNANSTGKTLILNTSSNGRNAEDAGIIIQERIIISQDNSFNIDAAFIKTSTDRKQFKLKVPDCSNVCALNLSQWVLPPTIQNGILVITNGKGNQWNGRDEDICYNVNVSSYDISNILYRDKVRSNDIIQVIPSNLEVVGNIFINPPINPMTSAMTIKGNISHTDGWITQF